MICTFRELPFLIAQVSGWLVGRVGQWVDVLDKNISNWVGTRVELGNITLFRLFTHESMIMLSKIFC